ncbi:MAG: helix-turn-helix domain-containing protein, partial [Solobacterium sp.]|nr:helix-turn-helix domain-containing protein [Solobacterium sp.]
PCPDGWTGPAPTVDYADSHITGNGPAVPDRTDEDCPPDTWPVRNDSRLIGLLCIHRDLSVLSDLSDVLSRLKSLYSLPDDEGVKDRASTLSGWMEDRIQETIEESGIRPERMNRAQKLEILRKLQAQGIMDMKGCVPQIAARLAISVPTVYRYLKRL